MDGDGLGGLPVLGTKGSHVRDAFVRFTNGLQKLYAEQPTECAEVDALLAHVCEQNEASKAVRITDLVRAGRFGTLPTLSKRLREMEGRGLIRVRTGVDRRTHLVELAAGGDAVLESRGKLMREAGAGNGRGRNSSHTP